MSERYLTRWIEHFILPSWINFGFRLIFLSWIILLSSSNNDCMKTNNYTSHSVSLKRNQRGRNNLPLHLKENIFIKLLDVAIYQKKLRFPQNWTAYNDYITPAPAKGKSELNGCLGSHQPTWGPPIYAEIK